MGTDLHSWCIPNLIYYTAAAPTATCIRGLRVQTQPGSMDFLERKKPEHDFLWKGSKAMGPMSQIYGM